MPLCGAPLGRSSDAVNVGKCRYGSLNELERWFNNITDHNPRTAIFNGECNCFPRAFCQAMDEQHLHTSRTKGGGDGGSPFKYLNSGVTMMRKTGMIALLEQLQKYFHTPAGNAIMNRGTDQAIYQAMCWGNDSEPQEWRKQGGKCFVDYRADVMVSAYPTLTYDGDGCNNKFKTDLRNARLPGPSKYANVMNLTGTTCKWKGTGINCISPYFIEGQPALVHLNGRSQSSEGDISGATVAAFMKSQINGMQLSAGEVAARVTTSAATMLRATDFLPVAPQEQNFLEHCSIFLDPDAAP